MKKYNFDEIVERHNTGCVKYDGREAVFGNPDIIPLWVADMDFKVADVILEDVQKQIEHGILGYPFIQLSVYKSIITWLKDRHQWDIKAHWLTFCPGVVPGLGAAVQAFTKPGDKIIIQPPVYHPFFYAITNNDRVVVENRLIENDGYYTMDYADLEEKLKDASLLILCNPHNPVGRSWSKEELTKLSELCLKYNVLVISDEIHADLNMPSHKHTPTSSLSPEISANTFTFMASSKTFNTAGLSQAFAISSNEEVLKAFNAQAERQFLEKSLLGLVATRAAFEKGEEWRTQLIQYISDNADYAISFLNENLPLIKARKLEATYLLWVDFRGLGLEQDKLVDFLVNKAGIGMNNGKMFGENGRGFMRMNLACPRATLEKALHQLEKAIASNL
ncbi:MAG: PatB family C-S lyase [Prevotellaceae bacterium]|jgi:cystathionine beta-lyase|nr:PatB family C-S lyase [Prevotellaceae bacterium]